MAVVVNVVGRYDDKDIAKAKAALDGLGKQASGPTARGLGVMRTAALAAGAAIAVRFGTESVKAYADAEQAQAKLAAAFTRFPGLADTNIERLQALNSELQRTTIYEDDTTAAAQAVLAQFNLTGQQLEQVTPLLMDYATATGQELPAAAESLGKAFMGNARALKAVGIDFKATGDRAADFATITAALRKQVGGLAEVEGATATGQLAQLTNAYGDLQEQVGQALIPVLQGLVNVAKPVVGVLQAMPVPVRQAAIAVGALGAAAVIAGPRILMLRRELAATTVMAGKSGAAIRGVGKAMAAIAITQAVAALDNYQDKVNSNTDDMEKLLTQLGRTGQGFDQFGYTVDGWTQTTSDFNSVINRSQAPDWLDRLGQGIGSVVGMKDDLTLAQESLTGVDNALAGMVKAGHTDDAIKAVAALRSQFEQSGGDLNLFDGALVNYQAAIKASVPPTVALIGVNEKLDTGIQNLKATFEELQGLLTKRGALRAWKADLDGVGKAVKEAGGQFGTGTEKGRAFNDFLDSAVGNLASAAQAFKNPQKQAEFFSDGLGRIRATFIKAGVKKADVDQFLAPFKTMKGQAKTYGGDIAEGLAAGIADRAAVALARARALGKATALAVKDGAQVQSPSKITIKVGEEVVNGLTAGVLKKAGGAKAVIRSATKDILSGAEDVLSKFQDRGRTALDFINGIKGSIIDSGAVTQFQPGAAQTTWGRGANAGDITGQMGDRVRQAQQFAKDVGALRKLGLNNRSLQEIISAGPTAGDQIAQALLNGGAGAIGEVNSLEKQLAAAGASVGNTAGVSQYGLNASQAQGLMNTSVKIEKGAVVVQVGNNVTAKDRAEIEAAVDKASERLVRKLIRELRAGK